jgi:RNA-directed DNA polymerase
LRSYRPGTSLCFIIREPKQREIFAADFRDRIVHHLLFQYLNPVFDRLFIYDAYSCRTGKGTGLGIRRVQEFLRSCSDNYRKPCWVLKLDIQGYFMAMNKERLYRLVMEQVQRREALKARAGLIEFLLHAIVFQDQTADCRIKGSRADWDGLPRDKSLFHTEPGCGFPIGNLTSQLFSNIYLNALDHFMKRQMKCRYYGRYVDDLVVIHPNKDFLQALIPRVRDFLTS